MFGFVSQNPLRRIPRDSAVSLEHGRKPVKSFFNCIVLLAFVLSHQCFDTWLGDRDGIWPVKNLALQSRKVLWKSLRTSLTWSDLLKDKPVKGKPRVVLVVIVC